MSFTTFLYFLIFSNILFFQEGEGRTMLCRIKFAEAKADLFSVMRKVSVA